MADELALKISGRTDLGVANTFLSARGQRLTGSAALDLSVGGTMTEPKVISPGQTRGSGIEGGTVHHLSKGDVITIPAGTPHQWKDTSKTGSVCYYAVNFES